MQNAARVCAKVVVDRFRPRRVLILCGPGNNGGDGLAMAPLLAKGAEVRVLLAAPPKTREARAALRRIDRHRVLVEPYRHATRLREHLQWADLAVDALLGSGLSGPLRPPYAEMVRAVNRHARKVLSIDVPTGYEGAVSLLADVTVALHDRKEGTTKAKAGTVLVRDIGIPAAAATEVGPGDFAVAYPRNAASSHKGQNGRVLVVAGGPYTGAPVLSAMSALRSGVDLVRLYAPTDVVAPARAASADLIVHAALQPTHLVPEDAVRLRAIYPRVDALLIGPGLGNHAETDDAVERVLADAAKAKLPTILDADALAVAGRQPALLRRLRPVATPHHGEFRELTGVRMPATPDRQAATARREARRLRATLLVKGPVDHITDGRRAKRNLVHHPSMTVGGTGDVLAGLVAGFVAKGMDPFHASCAAAFVNGDAGRRAAKRQGGSVLASDLVREIPRVFRAWLR